MTGHAATASLNYDRPLIGIGMKVFSAFVFTIMISLIKYVGERVFVGEIVFARNFFGILPILAYVIARGELATVMRTKHPFGHLGRGIIGVLAMGLWFTSLTLLPLSNATAISFAAPLFTVALASIFLHERVRIYRWSAVAVGFVGILVILSPNLGGLDMSDGAVLGAGLALVSAAFMATAMVLVRRLTETEHTTTIVMWFSLTTSVLALSSLPFGWSWPSGPDLAILVAIGILGGIGQIALTQSYRYAGASTIAPFDYTTMIWAVLIGWLAFAEIPSSQVVIGAVIVISAGLFVIFREHRLGIDRSKARQAMSPVKA